MMIPATFFRTVLSVSSFTWAVNTLAACDVDLPSPNINLTYARLDSFQVDSPDNYQGNDIYYRLTYQGKNWRASHEYLALDLPEDNLSTQTTNGHLHTLVFGYSSNRHSDQQYNLLWEVLPTLSISSNQLKYPNEISSSSLRLDGYLIWKGRGLNNGAVFAGGCATALTGDYKVIAVAGFTYSSPNWAMLIGYPNSKLEYTLNTTITAYSSWEVSGNQWEVLDKNLKNRTDFHLSSKQLKLGFRFNLSSFSTVDAYWLHHYDQRIEYFARNDTWISSNMDNTNGWMIRYIYLL